MAPTDSDWLGSLRCPRCLGGLIAGEPLRCDTCGVGYPSLGGIPVLLEHAYDAIDQWRFRLSEFRQTMDATRARIVVDLATKTLHASTRARLQRLAESLERHRDLVTAHFAGAGLAPAKRTAPEQPGVPGEGSVTSYFHQVHRDWGWEAEGSQENLRALEVVADVLQPPLGRTLVIGAGACRLASDLHTRGRASLTFAIDINPLPLLLAARVLTGERVPLLELPLGPIDLAHVCVERELVAPAAVAPGFVPLFADAFTPPFADGSFDTVVTPWFIDEVPTDLATYLPVVHRLLRPGGTWIDHGPLIYHPNHTELPARYPSDELFALVEAAGFTIEQRRMDRLVYMQSPACTRGRIEAVFTFRARRGDGPTQPRAQSEAPAWLSDPELPIPRFAGLDGYRAPHPFFAAVVGAIDGSRSARAIAQALVDSHRVPQQAALPGVQACLAEVWRACGPSGSATRE
ncbi:MAG: methyltransferase domain-containing protein [Nannocystaceae bacterium]|nr:methyltransferase domain-containing protein [Nannocystaceae bacterium]